MVKTLVKGANGIEYKITENGTAYHAETPEEIIKVLETCRMLKKRVRLFYGDTQTGRDWLEEFDTMGYIGRSTGQIKIPLLIKTVRSMGGGAILDHCIVRITVDGKDQYRHPSYHLPTFEVRRANESLENEGYTHIVVADGKHVASFKNREKAECWISFMKGERNRKN